MIFKQGVLKEEKIKFLIATIAPFIPLFVVTIIGIVQWEIQAILLFLLVILLGFVLTRGKEIKKYSIYIFITFLFLMSQLIFLGLTPNNSIQFRYLFPAFLAPVLLLSSLFEYFKSENKRIFYMLIGFVICSTYFNLKFFSFNELKENTNRNIIFNGYLSESRRQLNKDDNILLIQWNILNQ